LFFCWAWGETPAPDTDTDYVAGRTVYRTCAACHHATGTGGSGPALDAVRTTFPDCSEHQRWISYGSERWKAEVGDTYGTNNTEIGGVMPEFARSLSPEQIAQVAYYERVRFDGGDEETERIACGL
jgi:mono/diheme cytochrome c family protein